MKQDQMQFANACIFDKMIWPENDDWVRDLIYKMKEKRKELDNPVESDKLETII